MYNNFTPSLLKGILAMTLLLGMTPHPSHAHSPDDHSSDAHSSDADDWHWVHDGMAEKGRITGGFRVGPSFTTQDAGLSTAGPLINFQGLYGLNNWFRIGMMLEWDNHGLDRPGSGSMSTITVLPVNLEYRPGRFGNVIPYVTTGIGVNINTKDVADSFAWRIGGGVDYALTNWFPGAPQGTMLNVETAWKRNHANGDASTIGLLFGVRHTF